VSHHPATDEPAARRLSKGQRLSLAVLGLGLAAFAIGFLFTAVFLFGGGREDVVAVPDLRGMTETESRRIASLNDLPVEARGTLINPEVPAGLVLAQSPLPGEEVARGSVIRVTLSAGAERRQVPELRTLTAGEARQLLVRSGFEVEVEERTDRSPPGRILEVMPAPGTQVELPATIRLVISSGPPRAPVPSVVGLREDDARQAISDAGFYVSEVERDEFALQSAGTVTAQVPGPGGEASVGSGIRITVASSPIGNP